MPAAENATIITPPTVKYGRLYNSAMATRACPSGWHLPNENEYETLYKVGDEYMAGKKLKSKSGWNTGSSYKPGTDEFGFSALPSGGGYSGGGFDDLGYSGYWWSASADSRLNRCYLVIHYDSDYAYWGNDDKDSFFSIRCIKD